MWSHNKLSDLMFKQGLSRRTLGAGRLSALGPFERTIDMYGGNYTLATINNSIVLMAVLVRWFDLFGGLARTM